MFTLGVICSISYVLYIACYAMHISMIALNFHNDYEFYHIILFIIIGFFFWIWGALSMSIAPFLVFGRNIIGTHIKNI